MRTYSVGEDLFWIKVDKSGGPNACWPWTAGTNKRGYGRFHVTGTFSDSVLAHRWAWKLEKGPIPEGLNVLHSCDNPPCCNTLHLFLGTRIDNNKDMRDKGRGVSPPKYRGVSHPRALLTEAQVLEILSDPITAPRMAEKFNVSTNTIHRIRQGKSYVDIRRR